MPKRMLFRVAGMHDSMLQVDSGIMRRRGFNDSLHPKHLDFHAKRSRRGTGSEQRVVAQAPPRPGEAQVSRNATRGMH